jgi:3-oxoacid CoA-transferase
MDKFFATAAEAVADIHDGATIAMAGFGPQHCWARTLTEALHARGSRELTIVATAMGGPGELNPEHLIANGQVKKVIGSFTQRTGVQIAAERLILEGKCVGELVPQGIVAERCRAGGAGIAAFYSPTSVGTDIAAGKDLRYFNGKPYVMEHAIRVDFALLRAWRADRAGNVQFKGSTHNFNLSFAKSAKVAIIEVDEVVDVGVIPPDAVQLPGIFIQRIVKTTHPVTITSRPNNRRPSESARNYNGKPGLTRNGIAQRAAGLIREGSYVNLGLGLPDAVCNYLEGRDVTLHSENGLLGYGPMATGADIDVNVYSAGSQFVTLKPGAAYCDSVTSFEMARGGHLDYVIIGAYEVDQEANIANWSTASPLIPGVGGIGGAMDLIAGEPELVVVMEHCDSKGRPKLRKKCTLPLTAPRAVKWVVTDLALFRWDGRKFVMEETAPGFTVDEVRALTEMPFEVAPSVGIMA